MAVKAEKRNYAPSGRSAGKTISDTTWVSSANKVQQTEHIDATAAPMRDMARVFDLIPASFQSDLKRYFDSPLGQYALPRFLDELSQWWAAHGHEAGGHDLPPRRSLAGSWSNDPDWPNVLRDNSEDRD